jgi:hypothetical protein
LLIRALSGFLVSGIDFDPTVLANLRGIKDCGSHARANKVFLIRVGLVTLQMTTLLGTQKVTNEPCEGSNGSGA